MTLVGGEWSASSPSRFTSGKRAHGTHYMGGQVGPHPRVGLEKVELCLYLIKRHTIKTREEWVYGFIILDLGTHGEGQLHAPDALLSRKKVPGTYCKVGCERARFDTAWVEHVACLGTDKNAYKS
jgi:hypothetical protein